METKTTNQTDKATTDFSSANLPETFHNKPESETIEFVKPLKHPTQQKRVELIEKQKWELIAATQTIENQAATIKTFEKAFEIKDRTIKKQSEELKKLGDTCGNLLRAKLRSESMTKDLTDRNDNLKAQVVTANERIEILQHENKNYESAIAVLEGQNTRLSEICGGYEILTVEIKESRERLASKFTNWFIFLVSISIIEAVAITVLLLTNGSK